MHTGRDVHRDLVRRIRKVRKQVAREERKIDELQRQVAGAAERRSTTVRALSEFHLPGMDEESVAGTLAGMEAGIRAIHEEKKDRLDEVERSIPGQREVVETAEAALATVTQALDETGRERARLAQIVFEELQGMPAWRSAFEQVRKLEARVAASEKRHEAALREQKEQTPAYERDPFFAYLSRRRHGTATAAGNPLTRRLDRWVASVADYEAVRSRYDFLNALPGHAASVLEEDGKALAIAIPPLAQLEADIGDGKYTEPEVKTLATTLSSGDRAPYLLLGFGSQSSSGLSITADIGVVRLSDAKLTMAATGDEELLKSNEFRLNLALEEEDTRDDYGNFVNYWPIVSISVRYGISGGGGGR